MCTYGQRSAGLEVLELLLESQHDLPIPVAARFTAAGQVLNLLDIFCDNYETNRTMADRILRRGVQDVRAILLAEDDQGFLHALWDHAKALASSPRVLDTSHGSLLCAFSFQHLGDFKVQARLVEELLDLFSRELVPMPMQMEQEPTALATSLHGLFEAVVSCFQRIDLKLLEPDSPVGLVWRTLLQRILATLYAIAATALPVVGQNVLEYHELDVGQQTGHQLVVLCHWRLMKQVSFLANTLVTGGLLDAGFLSTGQIAELTDAVFSWLCNSRHRGVVDMLSTCFSDMCCFLWQHSEVELQGRPQKWLAQVMQEVAKADEDSVTRRSAGLPCILQCIMATEPTKPKTTIGAVETLLLLGHSDGDASRATRIHALNIMRFLVRDSQVGSQLMHFVGRMMETSLRGFSSPDFAIRNSSTMLFTCIVRRIFRARRGSDEVLSMSARELFTLMPNLRSFLFERFGTILAKEVGARMDPQLFPIFLLLSYLRRQSAADSRASASDELGSFDDFIARACGSPMYSVRRTAAKAFAGLFSACQVSSLITDLLSKLVDDPVLRSNDAHGVTLRVLYLFESAAKDTAGPVRLDIFKSSVPSLVACLGLNLCPLVSTTLLQVVVHLYTHPGWATLIGEDSPWSEALTRTVLARTLNWLSEPMPAWLPYQAELRVHALQSHLLATAVNRRWGSQLSWLADLVTTVDVEVRLTLLETLQSFDPKDLAELAEVIRAVASHVLSGREQDPCCIAAGLRLLRHGPALALSCLPDVLRVLQQTRSSTVQREALKLVAAVMAQQTPDITMTECLSLFWKCMVSLKPTAEVLGVRQAMAETLQPAVVPIFGADERWAVDNIQWWFYFALHFLRDDDPAVRDYASVAVSELSRVVSGEVIVVGSGPALHLAFDLMRTHVCPRVDLLHFLLECLLPLELHMQGTTQIYNEEELLDTGELEFSLDVVTVQLVARCVLHCIEHALRAEQPMTTWVQTHVTHSAGLAGYLKSILADVLLTGTAATGLVPGNSTACVARRLLVLRELQPLLLYRLLLKVLVLECMPESRMQLPSDAGSERQTLRDLVLQLPSKDIHLSLPYSIACLVVLLAKGEAFTTADLHATLNFVSQ